MPRRPKAVLITGGAGFIGSHLAEALLRRGDRVEIIDDLSTGAIRNIDHLKPNPAFSYVIDSVRNASLMTELIDRADEVYHLAAAVGVRLVVADPVRTIETNIRGAEIVLERAATKGKRTFIASSSEVYGKSTQVPFREDEDLILGPTTASRWCYACSKAIDEFLALAYHGQKGLPVTIARFFNTVGPRQSGDYGMVIPRFVRQALAGDKITVYGNGTMTRSFCHVNDTVRSVIALMENDASVGQVVNIGSDREISILDLARMIAARVKVRLPDQPEPGIEFVGFAEVYGKGFEDLERRVPDLGRLRRLIGSTRMRPLEQVIDDVIDYEMPQ